MNFIKVSLLSLIAVIAFSCNSSSPKTEAKVEEKSCASEGCCLGSCCEKADQEVAAADDISDSKVQVYYFHATRRCATCQAVEEVTKETIEQNFIDQVGFVSINRENETELAEKFKVSGQTLLIVSGDKRIDLTSEAFLNARTNPEKLTQKIVATINSLL
ncbi:nitrophenyl compound nitroreductase subunit ArsF family protein [Plebeiibacterium sediminum]|uniref:Thioredoxin family protein n=1 Tax=Plebeiibacterium sediminum TaxID=2992112 RepID=A0AAE3M729_9BACT|nr:nitrophenyl compound nitroreductase subunit ArsF family protein [Plebeiobacterium sediminum]MCW3788112.1 thioredoxin family protein [Plebeiobacterium sediminum]